MLLPIFVLFVRRRGAMIISPRHLLRSYEITFSEITPANRNRLGRNFTARRRLTWHAPCTLLAPFTKQAQDGGETNRILVTETMHRFTHFRTGDFREFWTKTWIGVVMNSLGTELRNCSGKESFTTKLFWVFFGTQLWLVHTADADEIKLSCLVELAVWTQLETRQNSLVHGVNKPLRSARASFAFRSRANLSIASYSRRAKGISSCSDFVSYNLPVRDIGGQSHP